MSSDVEDVFFEASEHEAASDADSTRLVDRPWQQSNGADSENTPSTPSAAETSRVDQAAPAIARAKHWNSSAKNQTRHSLPSLPPVPPIPRHILEAGGRPASVSSPKAPIIDSAPSRPPRRHSREAEIISTPDIYVERPRTSTGLYSRNDKQMLSSRRTLHSRENGTIGAEDTHGESRLERARGKSLSVINGRAHRRTTTQADARGDDRELDQDRSRDGNGRKEDLFLELAQDSDQTNARPPSRHERAASRLSQAAKRRSLPADAEIANLTSSGEQRPKSSGSAIHGRAFSRPSALPSDLQRQLGPHQSTPIRDSVRADDSVSVSGRSLSGRAQKYTMQPSRAYATPSLSGQRLKSPDLPSYGRRRPSFGTASVKSRTTDLTQTKDGEADSQDGSLTAGSERKHSLPESSAESQGAETVWDELDDLKSRIKKLELTGKLPTSSGAAISGESSERPRTATTAPTTITSSPKHDRKMTGSDTKSPSGELSGPNLANVHPLLHSALAKAKTLLQPSLYRMLEATASDSLQLAAMTGSAGPQGTAFSAASIINGVTVSDRHVRRKADAMCRNLTDLTLALCDGKHESTVAASSPLTAHSVQPSPTIRNSRSSIGPGENITRNNSRPVSRLEARRTSILGMSAGQSVSGSPRESTDDLSNASEQEGTPTHVRAPPQELRRISRSNSRLLGVRSNRYGESSADEDPTVRPPSRAMTDAGSNFRNRLSGQHQSPGQSGTSPSLRESLIARRANAGAHDANRELPRVSSLNTDLARRRWTKEVTPPVMEEEGDAVSEYTPPSSHSRRRVTSMGQFRERRTLGDGVPSRTASLSSRRHMAVE
ncbi:hypothetical protein D0864_06469 [Hortaea werneckii]|uniref:LPXTG-motif cell wall anchor domain protein n=1 Tax=Hortaea werneckii TaxID=91943 RepID=A0A3M7FK69_HORWE|nr:hypothetical protein KC317_g9804 [Hortaea werneckii]KAI7657836.1 hypothetical protein KC319_g9399 [Hortaea werneckii]KAI7696846.1 hypothetical protein KC322_g9549 [Hortaea werneckii]RMY89235.1 hypothetical protein D0864_06469 [Hortaea werneckii]